MSSDLRTRSLRTTTTSRAIGQRYDEPRTVERTTRIRTHCERTNRRISADEQTRSVRTTDAGHSVNVFVRTKQTPNARRQCFGTELFSQPVSIANSLVRRRRADEHQPIRWRAPLDRSHPQTPRTLHSFAIYMLAPNIVPRTIRDTARAQGRCYGTETLHGQSVVVRSRPAWSSPQSAYSFATLRSRRI